MAVKVVKPVDTRLPMSPLTVETGIEIEEKSETEAETAEELTRIPLLCCQYSTSLHHSVPTDTDIDADWEEDIEV